MKKFYFNNHWKKEDKFFYFPLIKLTYDNCSGEGFVINFSLLGFSIVFAHDPLTK